MVSCLGLLSYYFIDKLRFDYSASCHLLAKRRFILSPTTKSHLFSDPSGVPNAAIQGLPSGYDLRLSISVIFVGLRKLTGLICFPSNSSSPVSSPENPVPASSSQQPHGLTTFDVLPDISNLNLLRREPTANKAESAAFVSAIDRSLYHSYCTPEQTGTRSRRGHIMQSYHLLALIYTAFISHLPVLAVSSTELFLLRLSNVLIIKAPQWGSSTINLFRFLLSPQFHELRHLQNRDDAYDTEVFEIEVEKVIDSSVNLDWEDWRNIKSALLEFFVSDNGCEGRLQVLWSRRVQFVTAQSRV